MSHPLGIKLLPFTYIITKHKVNISFYITKNIGYLIIERKEIKIVKVTNLEKRNDTTDQQSRAIDIQWTHITDRVNITYTRRTIHSCSCLKDLLG